MIQPSKQPSNQKPKPRKSGAEKPCDRCTTPASLRYRCQYDASGQWQLVCPSCWEQVSQDNPHYRYGGTWKAKKKKA